MLIKYLQWLILQLSNSINESHRGTFITLPARAYGDSGQEFKTQFYIFVTLCMLCLVPFRLWSHLIIPWGLLYRLARSLKTGWDSVRWEKGSWVILGSYLGFPLEFCYQNSLYSWLNNWNFLIPWDLSTCINLSRYKTSVAWKVLNLEYANASVFWVIKGSKPEKRITKSMLCRFFSGLGCCRGQ